MLEFLRSGDELFAKLFHQCRREILHSCIANKVDTSPIDALLKEVADDPKRLIKPEDVYTLESFLVAHLHADQLKLKSISFRDVLRNHLSPDSQALLARHLIDLDQATDEVTLRAEVQALCSRLYRRYGSLPSVERQRSQLAYQLLGLTCFAGTLFGLVGYLLSSFEGVGVVLSVMFAGATGAAISTLMRLYQIDPRSEPGSIWLSIHSGRGTILIAPLLGMIFALFLYVAFRANLISGAMFPNYQSLIFESDNIFRSIFDFKPCSSAIAECERSRSAISDLLKIWAWAFTAGWAERLVPDVLDRLTPKVAEMASSIAALSGGAKSPPPK